MRTLLVTALAVAVACTSASADVFPHDWLRGASSVAVSDDATALFMNPAGLGVPGGGHTYASLSMIGENVSSFSFASKQGPLGFAYDRRYLLMGGADSQLSVSDDAVDIYYAGIGMGDGGFSVGFDYRWFRAQFGDEEKGGTWDAGILYRPGPNLSIAGVMRNITESDFMSTEQLIEQDRGRSCECNSKTTYVLGAAYRPMGSVLTLMGDASLDRDDDLEDARYTLGAEAMVTDGLTLRGSVRLYPDSDDREQEMSFGAWFDFTYAGVGASYRELDAVDDPVITYEAGTSERRQKSLFRLGGGVAEIKVSGSLSDFEPGWSLMGKPRTSAQRIVRQINTAARDESIDCILLRIRLLDRAFLGAPPALVEEVRDAVVRAKQEHGVRVVAFLEYGGGTPEYFLATAADRIVINPSSAIDGIGSYVNVMRYTGTTEKVGIEWDYMSAGEYKSTFHSLGAGPLTEAQREEVQSLVDSNHRVVLDAVMEGRGLSEDVARELCDGRLLTPPNAVSSGLVDEQGFYEDAKAAALKLAGGEVPDEPEDIVTTNVAGWRDREYDWGRKPVIAVVGAYGGIHEGEGGTDPLTGSRSIGSETLVAALKAARKDPNVKAVILRVDSGGGSGLASDIIWHETAKLAARKPFIVSMGDMAGSGGYYIAVEAEQIFAEPLTLTGSIGVVGMKPVFAKLYDKIDATYDTFRSGEHADQWSLTRKLTDDEMEMAEEAMAWFYDKFLEKASENRGIPMEQMRKLAEGRVYTGTQAMDVGLIDRLGGLSDAIDYACEKVGVDRDDAVVAYYREGMSWLDEIFARATSGLGLWRLFSLPQARANDALRLEAVDTLPID